MRMIKGQTMEYDGRQWPLEYYIYDSLEELIETSWQTTSESIVGEHVYFSHDDFIGRKFRDWDHVLAGIHTPWAEGLDILDRMLGDLDAAAIPQPVSRKRRTKFREDDGDELDYDRLRSGQDAWRTTRRASTRGPQTVTVMVDVSSASRVDHADILWRGAAAIALTQRLEEAGYRVELWAVNHTRELWNGKIAAVLAVCLKRPSDPLDRSTLIAGVSGWAYRTIWLRALCGDGSREISPCLGYPTAFKPEMLDEISRDANRILIEKAFTYEDALVAVRRAMAKFTEGR